MKNVNKITSIIILDFQTLNLYNIPRDAMNVSPFMIAGIRNLNSRCLICFSSTCIPLVCLWYFIHCAMFWFPLKIITMTCLGRIQVTSNRQTWQNPVRMWKHPSRKSYVCCTSCFFFFSRQGTVLMNNVHILHLYCYSLLIIRSLNSLWL